jgi:hypothetical protein
MTLLVHLRNRNPVEDVTDDLRFLGIPDPCFAWLYIDLDNAIPIRYFRSCLHYYPLDSSKSRFNRI